MSLNPNALPKKKKNSDCAQFFTIFTPPWLNSMHPRGKCTSLNLLKMGSYATIEQISNPGSQFHAFIRDQPSHPTKAKHHRPRLWIPT